MMQVFWKHFFVFQNLKHSNKPTHLRHTLELCHFALAYAISVQGARWRRSWHGTFREFCWHWHRQTNAILSISKGTVFHIFSTENLEFAHKMFHKLLETLHFPFKSWMELDVAMPYIYIYMQMHVCIYRYIYIYNYMYIYTDTTTHIYTIRQNRTWPLWISTPPAKGSWSYQKHLFEVNATVSGCGGGRSWGKMGCKGKGSSGMMTSPGCLPVSTQHHWHGFFGNLGSRVV